MNNKFILKSILLISIFSLLAAYFIEYILNYKPCNLCIFERIPYFASSVVIVLNLYSKRFEKFTFGNRVFDSKNKCRTMLKNYEVRKYWFLSKKLKEKLIFRYEEKIFQN